MHIYICVFFFLRFSYSPLSFSFFFCPLFFADCRECVDEYFQPLADLFFENARRTRKRCIFFCFLITTPRCLNWAASVDYYRLLCACETGLRLFIHKLTCEKRLHVSHCFLLFSKVTLCGGRGRHLCAVFFFSVHNERGIFLYVLLFPVVFSPSFFFFRATYVITVRRRCQAKEKAMGCDCHTRERVAFTFYLFFSPLFVK